MIDEPTAYELELEREYNLAQAGAAAERRRAERAEAKLNLWEEGIHRSDAEQKYISKVEAERDALEAEVERLSHCDTDDSHTCAIVENKQLRSDVLSFEQQVLDLQVDVEDYKMAAQAEAQIADEFKAERDDLAARVKNLHELYNEAQDTASKCAEDRVRLAQQLYDDRCLTCEYPADHDARLCVAELDALQAELEEARSYLTGDDLAAYEQRDALKAELNTIIDRQMENQKLVDERDALQAGMGHCAGCDGHDLEEAE
jgi:hypothetical protein